MMIFDTNIFFSGLLYSNGNECDLLSFAEDGRCTIGISEYVLCEMSMIFERKGLKSGIIESFLDRSIGVSILKIPQPDPVNRILINSLVKDPGDRPILWSLIHTIKEKPNMFLVTGDKGFFTNELMRVTEGRIIKSIDAIEYLNVIQ